MAPLKVSQSHPLSVLPCTIWCYYQPSTFTCTQHPLNSCCHHCHLCAASSFFLKVSTMTWILHVPISVCFFFCFLSLWLVLRGLTSPSPQGWTASFSGEQSWHMGANFAQLFVCETSVTKYPQMHQSDNFIKQLKFCPTVLLHATAIYLISHIREVILQLHKSDPSCKCPVI